MIKKLILIKNGNKKMKESTINLLYFCLDNLLCSTDIIIKGIHKFNFVSNRTILNLIFLFIISM